MPLFHDLARDDVFRLETPNLWLRWPTAADAPALAALANDWDVARFTARLPHPYAPADAESFIAWSRVANARGAGLHFVLTLKQGAREAVGVIGVEETQGRAALGYWLGKRFWGRGLASEAARAATDAFFLLTEAERLDALALEDNAASLAVLRKLGFAEVERLAGGQGRHAGTPCLRLELRRAEQQARAARLPESLRSVTA